MQASFITRGHAEGLGEIEIDPALAEIIRLLHRPAVQHFARIADGDAIDLVPAKLLLDAVNKFPRRHPSAGTEFHAARFGEPQLDVRPADIDDERIHGTGLRWARVRSDLSKPCAAVPPPHCSTSPIVPGEFQAAISTQRVPIWTRRWGGTPQPSDEYASRAGRPCTAPSHT